MVAPSGELLLVKKISSVERLSWLGATLDRLCGWSEVRIVLFTSREVRSTHRAVSICPPGGLSLCVWRLFALKAASFALKRRGRVRLLFRGEIIRRMRGMPSC